MFSYWKYLCLHFSLMQIPMKESKKMDYSDDVSNIVLEILNSADHVQNKQKDMKGTLTLMSYSSNSLI